jgi:outer membrane protein assembly factor BamB
MKLCRLSASLIALTLFAADWPQFRGSNASGICSCGSLPAEFGPQKNVLWKTELPVGNSSPILVGDRIFLTAAEGDDLMTICLSRATGEVQWRRSVKAARKEVLHTLNHRASATPVAGERTVFVFFGDFGLVAYDFDGNEKWRLPLGPFNNLHGMGVSPVFADDKVILVCDQDTDAYIIAVDGDTGRVAWKVARDVSHGFSTPVIYRPARGPAQIIAPGAYRMTAHSVRDGQLLWSVRGLTWQPKSAPAIAGDVLYFNGWAPGGDAGEQFQLPTFEEAAEKADSNKDGKLSQNELPKPWQPTGSWRAIDFDQDGFLNQREWTFFRARRSARNGLMAVKLGGKGDVTGTHVLWRFEKSLPDVPSPLVYDNVVFLIRSGGIATTLNARTGEVLKQARLTGALDDYYSSPVAADGKVYIASQHGKVVVLRAAGHWEILTINDFESDIYATPAMEAGRLYIRTRNALYAIGSSK